MKSDKATEPHAGALQREVDNLANVLTKPDLSLSTALAQARDRRRQVTADFEAVEAEAHEVLRRHQPDRYGHRDKEGQAAEARLRAAEQRVMEAGRAFATLKEREEQAFIADLSKKSALAAPVMLDVIALMHDCFNPAFDLAVHARHRGINPPRLLDAVCRMHVAMREVTAILNGMAAPKAERS